MKPCSICQAWHGEILSNKNNFSVIRCNNCGLYYVETLKESDKIVQYNDESMTMGRGDAYLRDVYHQHKDRWIKYYAGWLRKLGKYSTGRRLLDIGCGVGYMVMAACDMGWDAYGLDTSERAIRFGQKTLDLGERLSPSLLSTTRFEEKFDVITLFSVIEHIDDPLTFVQEVKAYLNDGGIILIKTPYQDSFITRLHWLMHKLTRGRFDLDLYNQEHVCRFGHNALRALLTKAGFKIIETQFDDRFWITATRYLFNNPKKRILKQSLIWVTIAIGKITRMENQFVFLAKSD